MSAIEEELKKATGIKPKPKERRQKYLQRLVAAAEALDPKTAWPQLSDAAQEWVNAGIKADEATKDIVDFAGAEAEGEEETKPKASKKGAAPKEEQPEEAEAEEDGDPGDGGEEETDVPMTAKKKGGAKPAATKTKAPAKPEAKAKPAAKKPEAKAAAPAKKAAAATNGTKPGSKGDGYKGHRAGSRKEQIHKLFDEKGIDAAKKKGDQLGLTAGTLNSWCASFKKQAGEKKKGGAGKAAD